ncbi:MAG: hypothetical protein ACI364_06390 [Coriobacteriales bacterium]
MNALREPTAPMDAPRHERRRFSSTAQMVETTVMLLVVVFSLAVVTSLLAGAVNQSRAGRQIEAATRVATNVAESFSANPASVPASQTQDAFTVTCAVTPEVHQDGTLYRAHILVTDDADDEVYELDTSRYVAGQTLSATGQPVGSPSNAEQGGAA